MAGLSHHPGPLIEGFAHVQESIACIVTTPIGSRVMRRDFGSRLPDLIDAPANDATLLSLFASVAEALDQWEPRFQLKAIEVGAVSGAEIAGGRMRLRLRGHYFPRGHLGDFATGVIADQECAVFVR